MKFAELKAKFLQNEFLKNVLTLMTGTAISQMITLAISPILTRMYSAEDFGILAVFLSVSSVFAIIANLRYEQAIMLPEDDKQALNLFFLSILIAFTIFAILAFVVIFFDDEVAWILGVETELYWLYLVPFSVFLSGVYNALNYFNNRKKYYHKMARSNIVRSSVLSASQLSLGFYKATGLGLIIGQILSQIFAILVLLKTIIKERKNFIYIKKSKIKELGARYKNFPMFDSFSALGNVLSFNLPSLLLVPFWGTAVLGFYALSYKIISAPTGLLGGSIAQVFYQKISSTKDITENAEFVLKTFKKLFLLGIVPFLILFFCGDMLFAFIFGVSWRSSGEFATILTPWLFLVFCVSPISTTLLVMEKQKQLLFFNALLLFFRVGVILCAGILDMQVEYALFMYSLIGAVFFTIMIAYIFKILNINYWEIIFPLVMLLLSAYLYLILFFI